ncbi:hypothetical protein Gpo141_00008349 [Globisporangium polare]
MTNLPYTPPPGDFWAPSQDGSFGSSSSSFAEDNSPDSGGGRADFSSSGDGSGSRWQASGSGDAGWPSQTSAPSSSSGSGWENPIGEGWNGLWNFKGGWNWDSPYPPPAGITLETNLDGEIALMPRRKVYFNPSLGFSVSHDSPRNKCAYRFCLNVTISSNYGAMSAFDAFVMDRYESKSELGSDAFTEGGPLPMVNGMMSDSELLLLYNGNANESATSKYNHTRKTSWMLYPRFNDTDEIDVVMSFKQLYTLLPDYNGTDPSSDGPFYSDDPNDQVILRLTARLASSYASSTAILPQVFESKGSRLFDVDFTSSIVYDDEDNGYSSNQIELDLVFSRKGYGGFIPWMPVQLSSECQQCDAQMMGSSIIFEDCLKAHVNDSVFSDLLSPDNSIKSFDLQETCDDCFSRLMTADFSASAISSSASSSSASSASSSSASAASQDSGLAGYDALERRLIAISQADAGVRCYINSQCPIGDNLNFPSDGNMVVFACDEAAVRATFFEPDFEFQLELTVLGETGILTLEIASDDSEEKIAQTVKRAIPVGDQDHLNVTAQLFNNSMEIYYANKWNEWLMNQYTRELEWAKSSSSSSSSGSSESAGTAGSMSSVSSDGSTGSEGSGIGGGPTGSGSFGGPSSGSSQGGPPPPPPPQRRLSSAVTPPVLYNVPRPNFMVEITFGNVSVVPNVTNVISSQNVQWEYSPMTLGFKTVGLDVNKFKYVPPPPQLDLGSNPADQSGPGDSWNSSNSSSPVNLFGSCGECGDEYAMCAADEDCRSAVRTNLYQALQRKNFPPQDSSIDISWVLRSAFMFGTPSGMSKFSGFISCLATRAPVCNIDMPRVESDPVTGVFGQGPLTYLRIEPAVVIMTIEKDSVIVISSAGRSFNYIDSGNPDALRVFLENNLAINNTIPKISVNASMSPNDATRIVYTVEFSDLLFEAPYFSNPNATATDIVHSPWRLWIEGPPYRPIDWQLLLDWLQPLVFDPRDTTPTTPGGGSNQPVPSNPTAICLDCMDKLSECLSDYECESSARDLLETQLKVLVPMYPLQQESYNVQFNDVLDSSRPHFTRDAYGKFLGLLNCLAAKSCAVGYNPSAATNAQIPTTVISGTNVWITVEAGSSIEMSYNGSTYVFNETGSALDFENFLRYDVLLRDASVWMNSLGVVGGMTRYDITVNQVFSDPLSITATPAAQNVISNTIAMFASTGSALPTWRDLLQWFGVKPRVDDTSSGMTMTPDVCTQCFPDIMDCMGDPICFATVRDQLVSGLRGDQVGASTSNYVDAVFDGFSTTFRLSLMSMLSPMANMPAFATSPSSWNMLSRALVCLASRPCDLKYTSAATAAPATAHAPTYLRYQKALGEVVLFKGTTLSISFQGQESSFVQQDDLSGFGPWLMQLVGGQMILNATNATMNPDTGEFRYELEIDGYVGIPPVFSIVDAGTGPVWPEAKLTQSTDLWFESVNQLPDWQKLIDFVSLTPPLPDSNSSTPSGPSSSGFQCPVCAPVLNNCYNNPACQMALSAYAIPSFRSLIPASLPTTDGRFEYDLTPGMTWNVISMASDVQARGLLMDVFKCSASSPCPDASSALAFPGSHANLTLEYPTSSFSIPSGNQMTIYFQGMMSFFQDSDDTGPLKTFLEDRVLADRGAQVVIQRYPTNATTVSYQIVYEDLYLLTAPHFSWQGPAATDVPQGMGVESTWRFVFSSTEWDIYASFKLWIDWLATNGNLVTAPM